ncbi:hypothetical protein HDU86_004091 [Geranomyces michiganensis]|nr:hypothetical protein HDU86_004091 [Geranomyces michiganensis]
MDPLLRFAGTAISAAPFGSTNSLKGVSPGASPLNGPQYTVQPSSVAGVSPSAHQQQQPSHYPSLDASVVSQRESGGSNTLTSPPTLGKSLKSPRIYPSRRGVTPPSKPSRSTGRYEQSADGKFLESGVPMDVSSDYITPPHYPQDIEFTLDALTTVDMPLASLTDLPSAYYHNSTSPQSPPPTPPLPVYESNQTENMLPDTLSAYAAATPMDFLCNPAMLSAPAAIPTTFDGDEDGEGSDEEDDENDDDITDAAGGEGANDDTKSRRSRNPKTPHKVSEKRRRELFKTHFDELTSLIPPLPNPPPPPPKPPRPVEPGKRRRTPKPPVPKPPNRIQMLHHAMDYLQKMEEQHRRDLEEVARLTALLQ